jgi:hypothetical protein
MKDRYVLILTFLGALLIIIMILGFILFRITDDLRITANTYKNDKNICEREYEELVENYQRLLRGE